MRTWHSRKGSVSSAYRRLEIQHSAIVLSYYYLSLWIMHLFLSQSALCCRPCHLIRVCIISINVWIQFMIHETFLRSDSYMKFNYTFFSFCFQFQNNALDCRAFHWRIAANKKEKQNHFSKWVQRVYIDYYCYCSHLMIINNKCMNDQKSY